VTFPVARRPNDLPTMTKALFLDRDGTLILDKVYLADPAGVELLPGAADALTLARTRGYKLFLFTNQSGIGRGLHTLEDTRKVNTRKPSPRFILEMIAEHRLDPAQCWMVGDSAADIGAGLAAHVKVAAVRTGKVDPTSLPDVIAHKIPVFSNIGEFANTLP
jgi:D-glycero-D-manno-heptose 1,7-bisphosphate phosphatase